MPSPLASTFCESAVAAPLRPSVVTREPLEWWEDAAAAKMPTAFSQLEQQIRSSWFRNKYPDDYAVCCATAWPPIDLHLSDYEHIGE